MCPKKCPKCCRKRLPCDCLPSDDCKLDEWTGEIVWSDKEESNDKDMSIDVEVCLHLLLFSS